MKYQVVINTINKKLSNAKGGELEGGEVILDLVTQRRLLKEAALEQWSEGSEEQAMKRSIPGKGNSKQKHSREEYI